MQKKILISLGLIAMIGLTTVQAMANSTIYTDELCRMHLLQFLLTDLEISIDMMLKDITM